jgi:geranylgeranyl pyrophosphate synthase
MTRRIGKVVVADLKKRSEKGLQLAKHVLQEENMEYPKLREALEHYVMHWNEFIHLGLFSVACEAVGGDPDGVVLTQAAIALMTAAFDVQDDIIDKSKEKNKMATVYGKFGVEIALLLANAFLVEGFKLLVDSTETLPREKEKSTVETVKKLLFEVGNAHALEVGLKERKNLTPNDYMKITEMKAASIEADMYLGALFGGGKDAEVKVIARMGRILGILATLRDDLIDVFDIEELRQRISVQDLPLPLLFAIQEEGTMGKVMNIISKSRITKSDVATLVDLTLETKSVVWLKNEMQFLVGEGLILINELSTTKLQSQLQALLSFMLEDL